MIVYPSMNLVSHGQTVFKPGARQPQAIACLVLKIASVQMNVCVCMCVCLCVCLCVCVCVRVCVSATEAINN